MAPLPPKVEADLRAYAQGRELPPSDPPVRAPHPSEAELELARAAGVPGFSSGLKHFGAGAERLGKRIAVLIGLAGSMGVVGSTVFSYMTVAMKSEKQLDAEAKERAWKENVTTQLTSINGSVGGFGATASRLGDDQRTLADKVNGVVAKQARLEGWALNKGFHP